MKAKVLLLALFTTVLLSQSIGLDNRNPDVFTKYKLPQTTLHAPYVSFGTYLNNQNTIVAKRNSFNLNFNPKYTFVEENDDFVLRNKLSTDYYNMNEKVNNYDYAEGKRYQKILNLNNEIELKKYNNSSTFYAVGANIALSYNDNESTVKMSNTNQENRSYNKIFNQNYSAYIGFGFGKLRNVTPIVQAIRFQERLKTIGHINNDLDDNQIVELAQGISRMDYYPINALRSGKTYWKDFEKQNVYNDLALKELSPYQFNYIMETFGENRVARFEGYNLSVNLGVDYSNNISHRNSIDTKYNYLTENISTFLSLNAEYSHQLSLDQQLGLELNLKTFYNLNNKDVKLLSNLINARVNYSYEISDRFIFNLTNESSIHLNQAEFINNNSLIINNLNADFYYFLADNLSANFSYGYQYLEHKYNTSFYNIVRSHSVMVGLSLYLGGNVVF